MRVLLSGGGTGGHINPALAIGGIIKQRDKTAVIEYVGTKKGLETTLVPKEGYKIHYVDVQGIKRKLTFENVKVLVKAVTSVHAAKKIIKEFEPDVVIGTGGYVCWPVLKAAAQMKIPTLVHEQNAYPGLAVKKLEKYVDKVLISFEETKAYFTPSEKIVLVGNPVKSEMLSSNKAEKRLRIGVGDSTPFVLSYGGSLGARQVNETVFEMIKTYSTQEDIRHIHATGAREWEIFKDRYIAAGFIQVKKGELKKAGVTVLNYIYDMPSYMAAADVVLCRAGAMTLTELAVMCKASVIIPSPNVTNNHQYKNAAVLEKAGAAILVEEKDLTSERLIAEVNKLVKNTAIRSDLENNIRRFAITDSLSRIYKEIIKVTSNK